MTRSGAEPAPRIEYRGPLDERHLQSVVRSGLRAWGLRLDRASYELNLARQVAAGLWLRDAELRKYLPTFVDLGEWRSFADADPYLWERVARAAGFGYRLGEELDGLTRTPPDEMVAIVGGAFNAAITAIDYVVDERPAGPGLLATLDDVLVAEVFTSEAVALERLGDSYVAERTPEGRLAIALVYASTVGFWRLYARHRNVRAWASLHAAIRLLRGAVAASGPGVTPSPQLRTALEAKGELPVRVIVELCTLASEAAPPRRARDAAAALGRAICLIDDLADLSRDLRRGVPSTAVLAVERIASARGSQWAVDGDLYECLSDGARELMAIHATLPAMLRTSVRRSGSRTGSAGLPARPSSDLRAFAGNVVGDWVGWTFEEDSPTGAPRIPDELHTAASAAARYLLDQRLDGYAEAAHQLRFPRLVDGRIRHETHPALLYPRSLILDALVDASRAGIPIPRHALDAEAQCLLRDKHRELRGGWSYIPTIQELPPDSDDLGVVLRALVGVGGPALAAACDEPIRLALDAADTEGGFPTWILDPRGCSKADRRTTTYLRVIGGLGVHPDAVANLLHALLEYAPARYQAALARGAGYLEGTQDTSGAWASKWYAGPYFATWHAVWVLRAMAPGSAALPRAARFLVASQHASGAWGAGNDSPTATALAICALAAFGEDECQRAAVRGVRFLLDVQGADGGWSPSPFIEFVTADGLESYVSRTTTTALALKAVLARSGDPPARASR